MTAATIDGFPNFPELGWTENGAIVILLIRFPRANLTEVA
jgi:hypothetical protein